MLNCITIGLIWLTAESIHFSSFALQHFMKEGTGCAFPLADMLLVRISSLYGPHLAALLLTLLLTASQIAFPKHLKTIQVICLCLMLLYAAYAVTALRMPLLCGCDVWREW